MMRGKLAILALAALCAWGCTYAGYPGGYNRAGFSSGTSFIGQEMVYGPMYYEPAPKPITAEEALGMVRNYLASSGNPNLLADRVYDRGDVFEIPVVTRDESLADVFVVDKFSGWIKSYYR